VILKRKDNKVKTTTEYVREARQRVLDNPGEYDYGNWINCAVGNLYTVTHGKKATDQNAVTGLRDTVFSKVMKEVNTAVLGYESRLVEPLSSLASPGKAFPMLAEKEGLNRSPQARQAALKAYDRVLERLDAHEAPLDG
jgi:hypothetical protein